MPYLGREPQGILANTIEGNLKVTGTISAESINDKLALNGSDTSSPQSNANDQILLEAGTLDDSTHTSVIPAMAATDNLLLEDVTPSQAEVSLANISAAGTSGQFLQSQGSLVAPTFADVSSGWSFVEKVTASGSSTVDIGDSTNVVAGFDYIIRCDDLDFSADQTNTLGLRFGTGSGTPSYQSATYNSQEHQTVATSNVVSNSAGVSELRFALTNINIGGAGAGETQTLEITIYNPNENQKTRASGIIFGDNSGNVMYNSSFTGERDVSEVVTSFQIVPSSGTIGGNFILCKRAIA